MVTSMSKTNPLKRPIGSPDCVKRRHFKVFLKENSKKKRNFFEFGKFIFYFAAWIVSWWELEALKKYKSNGKGDETDGKRQGWGGRKWPVRCREMWYDMKNDIWLRNREIKQINNKLNSINNLKTVMIMKKEMYVAPELEVLEVMVEAGFVASIPGTGTGDDL